MGRAFVFGDNIDTDVLAPGALMKLPPAELARHCLEAIDPQFASAVQPGDFVVAGRNFGLGSSREQAAVSLKLLGVKAVLAPSFARIFFRNAVNIGLPAMIIETPQAIAAGDELDLDLESGLLTNKTLGDSLRLKPLPPDLMKIIAAGGLMPLLRQRFQTA
jgi:3-isopropylmalate/(R)-2-methylmalate dehydratase small subunit